MQKKKSKKMETVDENYISATKIKKSFNFQEYLRNLLNLQSDTDEAGSIESIKRAVEFKGGNVWALVFAIFIASVGLNVNSTAVIIGAMLISPLMGPITGVGLAIAIYDFDLFKKSMRNLSVATFISVLTSTVYFTITPLNEAQSELLARTYPTIYDVLIAFFGGVIGIIATTRKEKSNAIPGVAIATALMPPLCTVGYGVAMGNLKFVFGAFYLFFINSFFIGLATVIVVRFLQFKPVNWVNEELHKKVKSYLVYFSVIVILPSIYMAYTVIQKEIFKNKVKQYVSENFLFKNSKVLSFEYSDSSPAFVEVSLVGETVSVAKIKELESKLPNYKLDKVTLKVNQAGTYKDVTRTLEILGMEGKKQESLKAKDEKILILENELAHYKNKNLILEKVSQEVAILFPEVTSFSFGELTLASDRKDEFEIHPSLLVKWKHRPSNIQKRKLIAFLQLRLNIEGKVDVIHQK